VTWVDAFVFLTLAVAFWGGYRSGAVRESLVLVSLLVALVIAGALAGAFGSVIHRSFGLATASAHLASFWLLFLLAFVGTRLAGWAADRTIFQPTLKVVSAVGGGVVACAKAIVVLWLILFTALFFPLATDVRATLRVSPTARWIEAINQPVYGLIIEGLPGRARPVAQLILKRHHL
jgi:membrane protein required for colicin V production